MSDVWRLRGFCDNQHDHGELHVRSRQRPQAPRTAAVCMLHAGEPRRPALGPAVGLRVRHRSRRGCSAARPPGPGEARRLRPGGVDGPQRRRARRGAVTGVRGDAEGRPPGLLDDAAGPRHRRHARFRRRKPLRRPRRVRRPAVARTAVQAPAPGLPLDVRRVLPAGPRHRAPTARRGLSPGRARPVPVPGRVGTGQAEHRQRLRHQGRRCRGHRRSPRRRAPGRRRVGAARGGPRPPGRCRPGPAARGERRALRAHVARRGRRPDRAVVHRVGRDRHVARRERRGAAGAHPSARSRQLCRRRGPVAARPTPRPRPRARPQPGALGHRRRDHRLLLAGVRLRPRRSSRGVLCTRPGHLHRQPRLLPVLRRVHRWTRGHHVGRDASRPRGGPGRGSGRSGASARAARAPRVLRRARRSRRRAGARADPHPDRDDPDVQPRRSAPSRAPSRPRSTDRR